MRFQKIGQCYGKTALRGYFALAFIALGHSANAQTGLELYGELNIGVLITDDGEKTDEFLVDNMTIPSRIGLRYTTAETEMGSFRFTVESGIPTNGQSFAVNQLNSSNFFDFNDWDRTDLRQFQLEWDTPSIGRISFGQGWMSTFLNGASDLSGTNNIAASNMPLINGGGRLIRTQDGALTNIRFSDGIGRLFGSRRFRLRYDTPSFDGLTLSASIGREVLIENDDQTYADIGLRYANNDVFDGFDFKADLGYSHASDSADYVNGSVALLHRETGLNVVFASGGYDDGSVYLNGKVGILRDMFGLGDDYKTAIALQYFNGDNFGVADSGIEYTSLSAVQYLGADLQIYATYAVQTYSDPNDNYQDGASSLLGARYTF